MLDREFKYYIENQDELVKKYLGKHLVIKDQKVQGDFDDISLAYEFAVSKFEQGTFLIQLCEPGEESYTQTYHSRVIFS